MLSLHRLCERSQRGGPAIVEAWALGHRDDGSAVRKTAVDKNRPRDQCIPVGQTGLSTLSWISILIGNIIQKVVRRRLELGDHDEHGTTFACTGCRYATRRCTPRPSHGDGTSFESRRPGRRTAAGCGDGATDASRSFRARRTSSQSSGADDGKHPLRGRRARTRRTWSWRAKCACPLTSEPWSGATNLCTATAATAPASTDGTST